MHSNQAMMRCGSRCIYVHATLQRNGACRIQTGEKLTGSLRSNLGTGQRLHSRKTIVRWLRCGRHLLIPLTANVPPGQVLCMILVHKTCPGGNN